MLKSTAKAIVVKILGWQVRRLRRKNKMIVIAVAGSIGKTSTKSAISQLLGTVLRVQSQAGNYNDVVTVPLVFFGHANPPNLMNPLAWLKLFWLNERHIAHAYPFDAVVVEVGTDGPGQLAAFHKFLHADIGVLTAIAPEHMEFFATLDDVAQEELTIIELSDSILANQDLNSNYLPTHATIETYGKTTGTYHLSDLNTAKLTYSFGVTNRDEIIARGQYETVSETALYSVLAAVAVGHRLHLTREQLEKGITAIQPMPGRMQQLAGIKDSLIIDDSYNASPEAVKSALNTLYNLDAPQRIALLGNMNELGQFSARAHEEIGHACDPKQLDWVITLGPDANTYLAPAAEKQGCKIMQCQSPYSAGAFIAEHLQPHAAVLIKGSQNGVFAEEAIKPLLRNPQDEKLLVRQSDKWLETKLKQFGKVN